ncbi:MAG: hypothetical protein LUO96_01055 [Methanomicrobiales archaeon]|nr:hypothetical protein [Methanomicrobiales archaeon]
MEADSHDEIAWLIARLVDDLMSDGGFPRGVRVNGYAIIAGLGGIPAVIRITPEDPGRMACEVTEGERELYITVPLQAGCGEPSVTLQPLLAAITLGGETSVIDLPCRIDAGTSSWQVRNGVLDISCRKA